jgi:hypothetical protein
VSPSTSTIEIIRGAFALYGHIRTLESKRVACVACDGAGDVMVCGCRGHHRGTPDGCSVERRCSRCSGSGFEPCGYCSGWGCGECFGLGNELQEAA